MIMAKVLGTHQLLNKKYDYLDIPQNIKESFGDLPKSFNMIVWGDSGNGKSSLLMQFVVPLIETNIGKTLYVSLEEGFEASIQKNVLRHLKEEHYSKIEFADYEMKIDKLKQKLSKRKSPHFIIIDSIQYWKITYPAYQELKETFPKKTFIFISHASGKDPKGGVAQDVRYDVPVKVFVKGYVATIQSRFGGNKPFVIWEAGAKKYWGDKYNKIIKGAESEKKKKTTPNPSLKKGVELKEKQQDNEETNIDE